MDENLKARVLADLEQILTKDLPPFLMARLIFSEVVQDVVETETEVWKRLAYAIPAD